MDQHTSKALFVLVAVAAGAALPVAPAQAVIVYGGAGRNTSPDGSPVGSGWQHQGQWGSFLGTPIASNLFITAGHVGGAVGQNFTYGSNSYATTASYDDPNSDLRIWKVDGSFGSYAPLYGGTSEAGKALTVFGRGTQRGSEVRVNGTLKGWQWGSSDAVQSWGQNTVDGVVSGGPSLGQLLAFDFDAAKRGGANEGTLSVGDSGGGLFVQDGTSWKLAGINYGVENAVSLTGATGSGISAAIFDKGGLYTGGDGAWAYNADTRGDKPALAYSTRISSNLDWINSVLASGATSTLSSSSSTIAVPEPSGLIILAAAIMALWTRRRRESE